MIQPGGREEKSSQDLVDSAQRELKALQQIRGLSHIIMTDVTRKSLKEINSALQLRQLVFSAHAFITRTPAPAITPRSI